MNNNDIRELASIMRDMGLASLEYQSGGESLKLTRPSETGQVSPSETGLSPAADVVYGDESPSGSISTVKSPMVGVFYSSPGVDEAPYVSVGDTVLAGDILCVIEAMKIMNEITAQRDGVITGIFAENKQVVEYGQPLFRISGTQ